MCVWVCDRNIIELIKNEKYYKIQVTHIFDLKTVFFEYITIIKYEHYIVVFIIVNEEKSV